MTTPDFASLKTLYKEMDTQWETVANVYSFQCNDCKENCCTSLFYHHTHIEQAYLIYGFKLLEKEQQANIIQKAKAYCEQTFANGNIEDSLKLLCPANEEEKCLLYSYRPMICRLHGLPHELHRPGAFPMKGPGCDAGQFDTRDYIKFDRTPFYRKMSVIEMEYRQTHSLTGKTKLTVAQILLGR